MKRDAEVLAWFQPQMRKLLYEAELFFGKERQNVLEMYASMVGCLIGAGMGIYIERGKTKRQWLEYCERLWDGATKKNPGPS